MKLDKQTLKKLNTLPKNQRILVKGKEMTVGEFKVQSVREQKQAMTKLKAMAPSPSMSAEACPRGLLA